MLATHEWRRRWTWAEYHQQPERKKINKINQWKQNNKNLNVRILKVLLTLKCAHMFQQRDFVSAINLWSFASFLFFCVLTLVVCTSHWLNSIVYHIFTCKYRIKLYVWQCSPRTKVLVRVVILNACIPGSSITIKKKWTDPGEYGH